jgi:hypothetical protein
MTRAEKAQLLRWVVRDLGEAFPGVESTPQRLRRRAAHRSHPHSRSGCWNSAAAGSFRGDLLRSYPTLRAEDLVNAWAYVRANRAEIEQQIQENEEA